MSAGDDPFEFLRGALGGDPAVVEEGYAVGGFVGLPAGFDFSFTGLKLSVNKGGAVTGAPAGTTAYVDWSTDAQTVDTGSSTVTIDMAEPITGISATAVFLNIGGFVSVRGSFAFEQGASANGAAFSIDGGWTAQ